MKDIDNFVGLYKICRSGRVFSIRSNKFLTNGRNMNGYLKVNLYRNSKATNADIHRLLATYYVSNPYKKEQVNHIDGNKLNNKIENLEWVTASENVKHAYTLPSEKRNSSNRYSKEIKIEIMNNSHLSYRQIAKKLGISKSGVGRILNKNFERGK